MIKSDITSNNELSVEINTSDVFSELYAIIKEIYDSFEDCDVSDILQVLELAIDITIQDMTYSYNCITTPGALPS